MDKCIYESEHDAPQFLGEPECGVDMCRYYKKATVEGFTARVGDPCLVLPEEPRPLPYIARIDKMYENPSGQTMCYVTWFYRNSDVPSEQAQMVLQRELLLTEAQDEIPLDSIKAIVEVFDSPEPLGDEVNDPSQPLTSQFFCNRGFLRDQEKFIALSTLKRLLQMSERKVEAVEGEGRFNLAKSRLQLNYVRNVEVREPQIEEIKREIIKYFHHHGAGGCLYISGVPGTGKTLCVREVMKQLAEMRLAGKIPDFDYKEVNCMNLESPRDIFTVMWQALSGERLPAAAAQRNLNEVFTLDPPDYFIILLVDEIDLLLTNQQSELYCLLEWSSLARSHLIIIAVANLMNLDSRLKPKISSRMGRSAVRFYAYKAPELQTIINSRIGDLEVIEPQAISLLCKKIANIGGDARKCLEVAKRVITKCEEKAKTSQADNKTQKAETSDVISCLQDLTKIRGTSLLSSLTHMQQLFLAAFLRTGATTVPMRTIINEAGKLVSSNAADPKRRKEHVAIDRRSLLHVCDSLVSMRVVKCAKSGASTYVSSVSLIPMRQDVISELKKSKSFGRFIEDEY